LNHLVFACLICYNIQISCGYNTFGHPSPETLEALEKNSILTYRTDLDGTVRFTIPERKRTILWQKKIKTAAILTQN
jgi:beta-lactamase superfamily II metal-dependent hydrolase